MKKYLLLLVFLTGFCTTYSKSSTNTEPGKPYLSSISFISPLETTGGSVENITIYPNPVINTLKIAFKSHKSGNVSIQLFNTIGKQVLVNELFIDAGNVVISVNIKEN